MEEVNNYINHKLIDYYEMYYQLYDGLKIRIVSNSEKGLAKKYFSKYTWIENKQSDNIITIYNIEDDFDEIPYIVKEISLRCGLRAKRMQNGYYNLHHFGTKVCFIQNNWDFYLIGNLSDSNQIIWSYLIKYILTKKSYDTGLLHLKGSMLRINDKGILILGDKASGKTVLTYNIINNFENVEFISNTHLIIDGDKAKGIKSNINMRKDMIKQIQENDKKLLNIEAKKCTNVDPVDLHYKIINDSRIDYIIFYKYNKSNKFEYNLLNNDETTTLINSFARASNVYGIHGDIFSAFNDNVKMYSNFCLCEDQKISYLVKNTKKMALTLDMFNNNSLEQLKEFLNLL